MIGDVGHVVVVEPVDVVQDLDGGQDEQVGSCSRSTRSRSAVRSSRAVR